MLTIDDIAKMIDHSLLKPELTVEDVKEGCKLADEYETITVCVKPADVALAKEVLADSDVKVTTVIGFPHGANKTETKAFEAKKAIEDGALELDMVLNIGRLRSGDYNYVEKDVKAVADIAHENDIIVKVIFENCFLNDEEKKKACELCEKAGADFVKTSTGFGTGGHTIEDLKLMRENCSSDIEVKAAGGVRTLDAALAVRQVGATRFGATATKTILDEAKKREEEGTLKDLDG